MKILIKKYSIYFSIISVLMILLSSCNKEYINPSSVPTEVISANTESLMNLAAGLQRRYTVGRLSPSYNLPVAGGYSVFALRTTNTGNVAETALEAGRGAINNGNSIVSSLWTQCLLGKNEAEFILKNLSVATDAGDKVGLKAYASIFYALNVGALCQFYEKVPLTTAINASFDSREDALKKVVQILESVDLDLASTSPSPRFLTRVPPGIDAKNAVKALLARFCNMLSMVTGTYNATDGNKAITFATAVDITKKSEFRFSPIAINAFGDLSFSGNVYSVVNQTLGLKNGLAPTPGSDPRVLFYIRPVGANFLMNFHGLNNIAPIPLYLPGEMNLIIAENNARINTPASLTLSVNALNAILTKTTDIYGVNALQPSYSGTVATTNLLTEIYKQRRLELFLTGMELEDCRRFNRLGPTIPPAAVDPTSERNRNFYPYPLTERTNNTNTPADPVI